MKIVNERVVEVETNEREVQVEENRSRQENTIDKSEIEKVRSCMRHTNGYGRETVSVKYDLIEVPI